jgi:hypothetical protein
MSQRRTVDEGITITEAAKGALFEYSTRYKAVRSRIKQEVCTRFTRVITLFREPPYAQ